MATKSLPPVALRTADPAVCAPLARVTGDRIYLVDGRRVSGAVSARLTIDNGGAPDMPNRRDPITGRYGAVSGPSYPAIRFDASPIYADRDAWRADGAVDGQTSPVPLMINGRRYGGAIGDLGVSTWMTFEPCDMAGETDADGAELYSHLSNVNRMTADDAVEHARRFGYVFADGVLGSDGVRRSGLWTDARSSAGYGEITDSARGVFRAIGNALVVEMIGRNPAHVDADVADMYARGLTSTIEDHNDMIERYRREISRLTNERVAINSGVLSGDMTVIGVDQ